MKKKPKYKVWAGRIKHWYKQQCWLPWKFHEWGFEGENVSYMYGHLVHEGIFRCQSCGEVDRVRASCCIKRVISHETDTD